MLSVTWRSILHAGVVVPGERAVVFRGVEPDDGVSLLVEDEGRIVDVELVVAEDAFLRRGLGANLLTSANRF